MDIQERLEVPVGYAFTAMEPIYYQHYIASNELMLKLPTLGGLPELMVTVSSGEKCNFCGTVVKCYCDDVADALGISLICGLRNEKERFTAAMYIDTINKEQRPSVKTNIFWHFLLLLSLFF